MIDSTPPPAQWSNGDLFAMATDDGITINGTLLPWSVLSIFGAVAEGQPPFVTWLAVWAGNKKPDGSDMQWGDMVEMTEAAETLIASTAPPEASEAMSGLLSGLRGLAIDESLREAGFPAEDATVAEPVMAPMDFCDRLQSELDAQGVYVAAYRRSNGLVAWRCACGRTGSTSELTASQVGVLVDAAREHVAGCRG